jgi:catechol 2,3-dioxygenase-like lactoylglutathione lyase family enzyme
MKNIHRCDHIGIYTNQAARLVDFYTSKLAFKRAKEETLDKTLFKQIFGVATDCRFIKLISDSVILEIFEPITDRAHSALRNSIGINHWGYCVEDREEFVQRLKNQKVTVIEIKRNDHRAYFVADPDGNRIEIRECIAQ